MCSEITEELEKIPKNSTEHSQTSTTLPDDLAPLLPPDLPVIKTEPIEEPTFDQNREENESCCSRKSSEDEKLLIKQENGQRNVSIKEIKVENLEERSRPGRRNKSTEARFRRKFEWGLYYEKYNIPKSSVDCIWKDCNYRGTNTYALEVHIRSLHEGILDFKCLYCDKGFRLAYPCQRHESKCRMRPHSPRITENGKSHDGENGESTENDVKCPQCDQTFSNQLALNAHCKLLHDGHNEMVLMALNDVRKSRGNRKRHDSGAEFGSNGEEMKKMRKSQGITFTNVVTGETYCGLCGLTTKNVHEHTQEKHTNNPPRFYCNVCDKSYTVRLSLKKINKN
jgi:transposase-like protein